jgi:hypothetical protein
MLLGAIFSTLSVLFLFSFCDSAGFLIMADPDGNILPGQNAVLPRISPPIFDSEKLTAAEFIKEYNYYSRASNWTPEHKISYLRHFLAPVHRRWYDSNAAGAGFRAWPDVEALFLADFKVGKEPNVESQLVRRVYKLDEPIVQYVQDKTALCRLVNPVMENARILEHVLAGLPPDWQQTLNLRSDLTLENIKVVLGKYQDNVPFFAATATSSLEDKLSAQISEQFRLLRAELKSEREKTSNSQYSNPNSAYRNQTTQNRSLQCYYCGILGHTRRDCRKLKRDQSNRQGQYGSNYSPSFTPVPYVPRPRYEVPPPQFQVPRYPNTTQFRGATQNLRFSNNGNNVPENSRGMGN